MPKPGEQPDGEQIEDHARLALAVTAEGDIHVFLEPHAEGDMPAAPEIGHAVRHVRVMEVFAEDKAEHFAETDSHIGISGEIEVYMEGIEQEAEPCAEHRGGRQHALGEGIPHCAGGVGENELFRKSADEGSDTGGKELHALAPLAELIVNIAIADDGSGDELGEQDNVRSEGGGIFLDSAVAAVNVDHVGEGLEGIEGYSHGKGDAEGGESRDERERGEGGHEEIPVFEEAEEGQVNDYRGYHGCFCFLF